MERRARMDFILALKVSDWAIGCGGSCVVVVVVVGGRRRGEARGANKDFAAEISFALFQLEFGLWIL